MRMKISVDPDLDLHSFSKEVIELYKKLSTQCIH